MLAPIESAWIHSIVLMCVYAYICFRRMINNALTNEINYTFYFARWDISLIWNRLNSKHIFQHIANNQAVSFKFDAINSVEIFTHSYFVLELVCRRFVLHIDITLELTLAVCAFDAVQQLQQTDFDAMIASYYKTLFDGKWIRCIKKTREREKVQCAKGRIHTITRG